MGNPKAVPVLASKRNKVERISFIRFRLSTNGVIYISDICEEFKVTDQTARADLDELERQGICVRSYGGATSSEAIHPAEKDLDDAYRIIIENIVKNKDSLFKTSSTVFIPGGSMFYFYLIERIKEVFSNDVTIFTNSIAMLKLLSRKGANETVLLPGQLDIDNDRTTGEFLFDSISSLPRFSTAILSINYINTDMGRQIVGFPCKTDGKIAGLMIKKERAGEIVLVSPPNVKDPKMHFLPMEVEKGEIFSCIQAYYSDKKKDYEQINISQNLIMTCVERKEANIRVGVFGQEGR